MGEGFPGESVVARDTADPACRAAERDWLVRMWATSKAAVGLAGAAAVVPVSAALAAANTRVAHRRVHDLAQAVGAWHLDAHAPAAGLRVTRRPASGRYVITSDLHRCIPGPLDWPRRQGVVELYAELLDTYAAEGWTVIENGDVEDFWMVGGSRAGVGYDLGRLATAAAGSLADERRRSVYGNHIDRVVDNYPMIYERLARLAAEGRYLRTAGNHDDVYTDEVVVGRLARHLPGMDCVDVVLLTNDSRAEAVIAHGHHTDSWNGPGMNTLGKAFTWLGTTLDDLPFFDGPEGPPGPEQLHRLLAGRAPNRVISVDRRFGGTLRFDSLDEQLLFEALGPLAGNGPWVFYGHTHLPVLSPQTADGDTWTRYANSGSGILPGAITCLEWEAGEPRLVLWHRVKNRTQRVELEADGDTIRPHR